MDAAISTRNFLLFQKRMNGLCAQNFAISHLIITSHRITLMGLKKKVLKIIKDEITQPKHVLCVASLVRAESRFFCSMKIM